jgi:ATP-dependent DNA helicase RecQ
VPSLNRPELVNGWAARLAARLNLPYVPIIKKTRQTQPQKEMANSVQQVRNMLGAFKLEGSLPEGPVLLIDDVIDSGWTVTLATVLLKSSGSGPVYPFVLAKASPRGS